MRKILIPTFMLVAFTLFGQEKEVLKTVENLFLAMETSDSTLASSLFTKDAQLHTVLKGENGQTVRRTMPASRLVSAFGSEKDEVWREPIWDEVVRIDGNLASVWVKYAFYRDNSLSHCGVDAFLLVKDDTWKIFSLADTRNNDCEIPEDIIKKAEGW
jgi:hypothetical protein